MYSQGLYCNPINAFLWNAHNLQIEEQSGAKDPINFSTNNFNISLDIREYIKSI